MVPGQPEAREYARRDGAAAVAGSDARSTRAREATRGFLSVVRHQPSRLSELDELSDDDSAPIAADQG